MQIALTRENHCVRRSVWHIEWYTKYRYKMMQKLENRNLVSARTRQAAHRHGIIIPALEVKAIWYVRAQQMHHMIAFA